MARPSIFGLVAAMFFVAPTSVQAEPACTRMKDAIGCACAAATGGMVSATSWARGPDRTAFEACLAQHGSAPAATRPTTISARP